MSWQVISEEISGNNGYVELAFRAKKLDDKVSSLRAGQMGWDGMGQLSYVGWDGMDETGQMGWDGMDALRWNGWGGSDKWMGWMKPSALPDPIFSSPGPFQQV